MFPLLVEIPVLGGIRIYTYGVLVAAAFVCGILWTLREAKGTEVSRDRILDLAFYIILAALAGSRVFYIVIEWDRYAAHPLDVLKIWEGGLVFYGGLIGAVFVSFAYLRRHHLPFFRIADLFAPGIALGHVIGRLGCFAAGCCYGRVAPAGSFLAVTFPPVRYSLAPSGVPLYATQLMESAAELMIFGILLLVRRQKKFTGQVFLVYTALYAVARVLLETFRAADVRGTLWGDWVSTSQGISLLMVTGAVVFYTRLNARRAS